MKKNSKRHSIRLQFAVIFIALMMGTLIICWLINTLFLKQYYITNKQSAMRNTYRKINEIICSLDEDEELSEGQRIEFTKMCADKNISVVVVTPSFETVITSEKEDGLLILRLMDHLFNDDMEAIQKVFESIQGTSIKIPDNEGPENKDGKKAPGGRFDDNRRLLEKTEDYELRISDDPRMGMSEYMELWGNLSNGDMIIMRSAVESIKESVAISNRFFARIGTVMAIVSGLLIWFISKSVTKPILKLADLSEKMAALDFDAKYKGHEKNEIGVLGSRMNELSEKLENTISELKTANIELQRDIELKEKQNSMRLEFLSNVAHELKTPIALISGYAEGLNDGIIDDAESARYYCDVIIDESRKMNELVKNLTNLNQLEYGSEQIKMDRFDIVELINNNIAASDILIKQNDIRVTFDHDSPFYVWGDEFKIEEVFSNYFSNAIHYCKVPENVRNAENYEKRIDIKIVEKDGKARISIYNTGERIPEESVDQLYDKFYKVDSARTHEYGGSGIGLSIVRAIMERHNQKYGVINYEEGVEFYFELDTKGE